LAKTWRHWRAALVLVRPDDSHRAKVHYPDNEEDRHQTGAAGAAVEAEAHAVSPGRAGVGGKRTAAPGCLLAAGKVTRLPRRELERTGDQDDHTDRDRNGARQRRLLHLDCLTFTRIACAVA
jgi:hypothetical protein